MPWVIAFFASWVIFFVLVDYSQLKQTYRYALFSLALGTIVDWGGQKLQLYSFSQLVINWFDCSAFYKFGPVLNMAVIFVQYVPKSKWLQALNIIVVSLLFLSMEYLILRAGAAHYIHWHILASLLVDLLTFSSFTWLATAFVKQKQVI